MRAMPLPFALVAALSVSTAACDKSRSDSIALMNEAVQKEGLGEMELAYALYARSAKTDPTNHRALYQMAIIEFFDKQEPARALERLKAAEALVPDDRDVLYQLGRYYATLEKPDHDKAMAYLDRALAADPNYAPAMYYKGVCLAGKNDANGADAALREAIAMDPKYAPAWRDLADLYARFDQQTAAVEVYRRGLEYADDTQELYNGLGLLEMDNGNTKDAILYFTKATEQNSERSDVVFNLAMAYVAVDDTKAAFRYLGEYLNRAGTDNPENVKVARLLRASVLDRLQKERSEAPVGGETPPTNTP
jgi:tetratricopeptide (TPR) repeat protein